MYNIPTDVSLWWKSAMKFYRIGPMAMLIKIIAPQIFIRIYINIYFGILKTKLPENYFLFYFRIFQLFVRKNEIYIF